MDCPTCSKQMSPLFLSLFCSYCEGPPPSLGHTGYVIASENQGFYVGPVFASRMDAKHFLEEYDGGGGGIKQVAYSRPFHWKSLERFEGITFAVKDNDSETYFSFYVYPDHKFKPGPDKCFIHGAWVWSPEDMRAMHPDTV